MVCLFDKSLVIEILTQIIDAIEIVEERCKFAKTQDDFCDTKEGQEKLDGICMKLIAVGESLKNIDKITDKKLLEQYPTIEWKKIKGIRDFISHHYFDLDADVIFDVCQNEIEELLLVLKKMKNDLLK
ncbi:HepT-like ribonuclease domain-containing protein [Sulfurimonas sp.]|uniref:HepT-like ribonuclease domain-containing protein n=1 Tax=Sulfurimonas sp. TaxID=2022749 RepID=UPI003D11E9CC